MYFNTLKPRNLKMILIKNIKIERGWQLTVSATCRARWGLAQVGLPVQQPWRRILEEQARTQARKA